MDMGRKFLGSLGIGSPTGSPRASLRGNRLYGKQAIEYVIRRAGSQLGVPYSWGGGSLNGPSRGTDSGANTVGFDCSGLTRYAFAGVGVLLPRYSGAQYDAGRKVPPAHAKRGDLLFWGPEGAQHEALYLGGGRMLEAQQTGVPIKISLVRTGGMSVRHSHHRELTVRSGMRSMSPECAQPGSVRPSGRSTRRPLP